ncbi:VWA domain-containing protein [Paracoccus sp. DMF-8]|uniref:VWA domain-containing protein n=1 Tax=Paracoccus sp. DMF-8 TaxID=3019445 RepID=UPI0023E75D46|nr:VWA domain-containing protein [Paracoccus sp. DMF-8]MDF3606839.1 VWA domain-containing protein [Paracoccus sp. DMF-8]
MNRPILNRRILKRPILQRMALPALAGLLALAALADPKLPMTRDLRDALVVVDVTRSMNVRDMDGVSRLDATRDTLLQWVSGLPCGSRIGLAIFTERRSLTLFEPVEICADYASIAGSLQAMSWRMAWEGDSMIAKGLNHALTRAQGFGVPLVLITDGQEAPPLPYAGPDAWRGDSPGGVIVGAGGDTPAPIPMFDDLGRETGFYGPNDVQHAPSRVGPCPQMRRNVRAIIRARTPMANPIWKASNICPPCAPITCARWPRNAVWALSALAKARRPWMRHWRPTRPDAAPAPCAGWARCLALLP